MKTKTCRIDLSCGDDGEDRSIVNLYAAYSGVRLTPEVRNSVDDYIRESCDVAIRIYEGWCEKGRVQDIPADAYLPGLYAYRVASHIKDATRDLRALKAYDDAFRAMFNAWAVCIRKGLARVEFSEPFFLMVECQSCAVSDIVWRALEARKALRARRAEKAAA